MEKTAEELQKELDATKAEAEENIKALQKKLTDKDVEAKKILADIEEIKKEKSKNSEGDEKIEALTKTVEALTGQIGTLNSDKRRAELKAKFPDILPDLLIGKSDEEAELIVNKQREITMQNYDEKPSAHAPVYKNRDEADTEMERIKNDKSLKLETKMQKIREIKLKRDEI